MKTQGKKKYHLTGWSMVMIASVLVLAFSYIPMIQAFLLSLQTGKGANLKFSGLDNYIRMIHDSTFWTTMGNTLLYAVIQIPVMLLLALVIAVLLNDPKLKGRGYTVPVSFCRALPLWFPILFCLRICFLLTGS